MATNPTPHLPQVFSRRSTLVATRPSDAVRSIGRRLGRRRWFVVAGLLSTLLPALLMALLRDAEYRAEATVVLRTTLIDDLTFDDPDTDEADDIVSRRVQNEITYLEGDLVRGQVKQRLGADDIPTANGIAAGGDTIVVRAEASTTELA